MESFSDLVVFAIFHAFSIAAAPSLELFVRIYPLCALCGVFLYLPQRLSALVCNMYDFRCRRLCTVIRILNGDHPEESDFSAAYCIVRGHLSLVIAHQSSTHFISTDTTVSLGDSASLFISMPLLYLHV